MRRKKAWQKFRSEPEGDPRYDPPPAVPPIRLSIRKEEDRWVVTALKTWDGLPDGPGKEEFLAQYGGTFRNEYTVADAREVRDLLDVLIGEFTCHLCGAPLWHDPSDRVVCSRHWNHYPQRSEIVKRCTKTYSYCGTVQDWGHGLPSIHSSRSRRVPPILTDAKLTAWAKTHLEVEKRETVREDGTTLTETRYTVKHLTAKQLQRRFTARRVAWYRKGKLAQVAATDADKYPIKSKSNGHAIVKGCGICAALGKARCPNHNERSPAVPTGLLARYENYCVLMSQHNMVARLFGAWAEDYQAVQARQCVTA